MERPHFFKVQPGKVTVCVANIISAKAVHFINRAFLTIYSLHSCLAGFGYTFGVLLDPLTEYYDSEISTVSWVGSLFLGIRTIFGPITGGLIKMFGLRPVCISGSIVLAIGLALSTLSPNIPILMLTIGLIGGFGASLMYLPANIAPNYYFETNRALALGITRCGTGI